MASGDDTAAGCGCIVLGLPLFLAFLLLVYGVFVIVMREAFGIELPNPLNWLPPAWVEFLRGWGGR